MIINEHPLFGMQRSDKVEKALQLAARVRQPEKVVERLARQLGASKAYGNLTQRQKDRLAKSFWTFHDRIGAHVSSADRLLIKILGEAEPAKAVKP
jgi:hypothetical protein